MKKLIVLLLLISGAAVAQREEVKNYEWDEVPTFLPVKEEFKSYPAVVLKDYRLLENRINNYGYKCFIVKHCAILLQSEASIDEYNKVSINKNYVGGWRDIKARVIKPDGKIELLAEDRIIEKEGSKDRQFVFEGVEKGDIIEYYYVIKDSPEFRGVEYFQRDIPVVEGKFQINNIGAGSTYVYGYNGMVDKSEKRKHIFTATDLPAYKAELAAKNIANLAKVYYFLDATSGYDYLSFYYSLNSFADGQSAKGMVKKFIEDQQLADVAVPLDDRLKKMDIYLKDNFTIDQQYVYKNIFDTKKITPTMLLYLYKDVLDYLKIPYQFVASTDKFEDNFDRDKVVPAALSEIMIYIPETQKFLQPFNFWMPYGPPSSGSLDNDAVFYTWIKKIKNVSYDFKKVGGMSMDENVNRTVSAIVLDDDMETVSVSKKSTFTGYRAFYYRNVMKWIPEDKVKDFVKDVVYEEVDLELSSNSFTNKEYANNYDNDKPFTFETEAKIKEQWVENAGKNYLITLGKVLGKQENLYQVTSRINPVDIAYPRKYEHTITFTIPDGYNVKNIDDLKFLKEISDNDKIVGKFSSNPTIEGQTLKISIEEYYDFTHLEKERFNEYRDLINASHDFYKSALVLVKA